MVTDTKLLKNKATNTTDLSSAEYMIYEVDLKHFYKLILFKLFWCTDKGLLKLSLNRINPKYNN